MKVILFGSEGTIGKYVKDELLKKKINLYLYQNKTKIKINPKYKIINTNTIKKNYSFSSEDILIYMAWGNLNNYNSVLHLTKELPIHYNNIKKLVMCGLKNIIVTGTCFEYKKKKGIMRETSKVEPFTNYGKAKNNLRIKLTKLKQIYKIKMTWVRIFYIFGHFKDNNNLWSQINKNSRNKILEFKMSSGEQYRDYMHVKDLARHIVFLALKKKNFGIINLCSGKPIKVRNLVRNWKNKFKFNINFKFNEFEIPKHESIKFWGCDKKLKKIIKLYEKK